MIHRARTRGRFLAYMALAAVLLLLQPAGSSAGFPGDLVRSAGKAIGGDVGKAVGSLGGLLPGGGGVVDQALGGVVGMPGQMVFGSAIKDFEGATGRSIDKLGATLTDNINKFGNVLTDNLAKADVILGNNIAQVDSMLSGNIILLNSSLAGTVGSLDQTLQGAVTNLDESLRKNVGGLDVVATKTSETIENVVRRLILYGCILVFLSVAVWQVYSEVYRRKQLREPLFKAAVLLAALSIIGLGSFVAPLPNGSAVKALTEKHLAAYDESMARLDFTRAAFNASQLRVLDSTNPRYEGLFQKALVMRDVLLRPATYSTALGRSDLALRIDNANRYLQQAREDQAQSDPDLLTLTAFVVSQMNPSREGMMTAANLAGDALQQGTAAFPLKQLAIYLVDSYVRYPISDSDFEVLVGKARAEFNQESQLQYKSLGELRSTLGQAEASSGATGPEASSITPIDTLIEADRLARDLYFEATPLYVEMVLASARAAAQTGGDPAKKQYKDACDKAANRLIGLFDEYTTAVRDPAFDGTTGRLFGIRGLHAIYSRAHAYLPQAAGSVPDIDLNLGHAVHLKWLDDQSLAALGASSQGPTAPGYFLLRNVAGISFRRQEKLLVDFEKDLHALVPLSPDDASKPSIALRVAQLAALSGLSTKAGGSGLRPYAIAVMAEQKGSIQKADVKNVYLVALAHNGGVV